MAPHTRQTIITNLLIIAIGALCTNAVFIAIANMVGSSHPPLQAARTPRLVAIVLMWILYYRLALHARTDRDSILAYITVPHIICWMLYFLLASLYVPILF